MVSRRSGRSPRFAKHRRAHPPSPDRTLKYPQTRCADLPPLRTPPQNPLMHRQHIAWRIQDISVQRDWQWLGRLRAAAGVALPTLCTRFELEAAKAPVGLHLGQRER